MYIETKMGRAYGFFNCRYPKERILMEIGSIRELAQTPHSLDLDLSETPHSLEELDSELLDVANGKNASYFIRADAPELPGVFRRIVTPKKEDHIKVSELKYLIIAQSDNLTNDEVARKISRVFFVMQKTPLFGENEIFRANVLFKGDDGRYVVR